MALYLIDTNILIRWLKTADPDFPLVRAATGKIRQQGAFCCYTSQNLGELWNTFTRPESRNGFGLSPEKADEQASAIERHFQLLPDDPAVHQVWRRLLVEYQVCGVQVHDARLVASMLVHGVGRILTFNTRDFARFDQIEAVHPRQLV